MGQYKSKTSKQEESEKYETTQAMIAEKRREAAARKQDGPPAPQTAPSQPAESDPGPDPGDISVDEAYIEAVGQKHLPDGEAAQRYRQWAAEGRYGDLAAGIIDASRVDLDELRGLKRVFEKLRKAETNLNTKSVPPQPTSAEVDVEPLPGIRRDALCNSVFDTSDLALSGIKAVTSRRFGQPLVLLDVDLPASSESTWLLGQQLQFQQEWRHAGFTLGELTSSLSLLPGEELTIEVSSYQRTKKEIEDETDEVRKLELSNEQKNTDERSCMNQTADDSGWSVSASGSVNFPMASASLSASAYGNSSQQAEMSTRRLTEATKRSTSEVSSRRAVKVTQTSEFGSESTSTRRLRNPNDCQTVTYNFFQVVKLYDIQTRLVDIRPLLLIPGIFPRYYGPRDERTGSTPKIEPTEVQVPVYLVEGLRSPAVFLTKYFEVDRDLSQQISGWALRLRADFRSDAEAALRLLAEGLAVAFDHLFSIDAAAYQALLADIVANCAATVVDTFTRASERYGPGKGDTLHLNSPGLYVDALRGRCSACSDHEESSQYVAVMSEREALRRLEVANALDAAEVDRRQRLLKAGTLEAFGSPTSSSSLT
ncbi:MAG: hypothetical protein K5821_16775 [Nitrobacter sp.]|uniref:hypothetical protein n=1 Tax=Nitrobacter sp. TaxID=29420 RepID=UPI00262C1825|nr:hypothetical protein [Nitrobacter sp.]MCV0388009.1 hypothetical protein [Nitrobacter sp.]